MKNFLKVLTIVISISLLFGLVSVAMASSGKGEVVVLKALTWDDADGAKWSKEVFEKFMALNPNIKIELQCMPQGYDDRLITSLAAGTPPDLFMVWDYPRYAELGMLEPLDNYDIDFSKIDPMLNSWDSYKGTIYGVAKDWTPEVIWYNKKVFDKYGVPYPQSNDSWTWENFRETAKKLTHPKDHVWGFSVNFSDPYDWENWIVMNGGDFLSPDGSTMKGYFDTPESIQAIEFLTNLYLVDGVSPSPSIVEASGGNNVIFTSNKIGMIYSGMWFLGYLNSKQLSAEPYGVVFVPHPEGKKPVHMLCASGWALAAASKHKEEAIEVLKFIAEEGGETQGEARWALPTREEVARKIGLLDDLIIKVFYETLPYSLESPAFLRTPDYSEKCSQYIGEMFDTVMLKKATVEVAVKEAVEKSEKAFGRE